MTLDKKFQPYVMNLLLVVPFSMVMSLVGLLLSSGFIEGWVSVWLKSLGVMIPIGYACGLVFVPLSQRLISKIAWK